MVYVAHAVAGSVVDLRFTIRLRPAVAGLRRDKLRIDTNRNVRWRTVYCLLIPLNPDRAPNIN